ncbi:MAG: peptidylprolyl isomerase [Candidatus Manganitrophaceae bacterium]
MFFGLVLTARTSLAWGGVVIDRLVVVVNREVITQSDLDEAAQALKKQGVGIEGLSENTDPSGNSVLESPAIHDLLNRMVEQKLLQQEAKRKGIRVTEGELELALSDIEQRNRFLTREALKQAVVQEGFSWEKYVEDLRSQLVVLKLMNREVDTNLLVGEEEVKGYYETHPEEFMQADQIRLKQILLRVPSGATRDVIERKRKKAEEILVELRQGSPFEQLVQSQSDGPERRNGGDLGAFKKGDLTHDIDQAVFRLKTGEISPVVQTDIGFHIFKVAEEPTIRPQPFEKVRKEIEEKLTFEKRSALRQKWLNGIWTRSFVEVK